MSLTTLTMYDACVPTLTRALENLIAVLNKSAAHAEARKLDPLVLTSARLFPDMFPLARQVQIATDMAKGAVARLAGIEPERFEDTEQTFAELVERIEKTIALIKHVTPAQFEGSEAREIVLKSPRGDRHFKGQVYLLDFVLPNVFFHCTTAYDILRHNGVELSKQDFLGSF